MIFLTLSDSGSRNYMSVYIPCHFNDQDTQYVEGFS